MRRTEVGQTWIASGGRAVRRLAVAASLLLVWYVSLVPAVHAVAGPANDFFADAVVVNTAGLPYGPVTLDTTYATTEANEPTYVYSCTGDYNGYASNTVWYRYNATADGAVQVNTAGSNFDTLIAVYQGTSINGLSLITCAHASAVFGQYVAFHAQAGLAYYIQVGGDSSDNVTDPYGSLHVAIKAQNPANDFFADAVVVNTAGLPYGPVTLDTTYATTEANEPTYVYSCTGDYNGYASNTVWYRYNATADGAVQVNTAGSNFDTLIAVYQGTSINGLSLITCAHASAVFGQYVAFHAASGLTYYIQVGGDSSDNVTDPYGSLHVAIKAQNPANDFFADAVVVNTAGLPYGPVTLDTTYATTEDNEPSYVYGCAGDYQGYPTKTVWYRYNATADGAVQVNTAGSNFDTEITVWQGTSITGLSEITCAHQDGIFGQDVSFHASSGLAYWIQISGDSSDSATNSYGSLTVSIVPPCTSAPFSDVTVDHPFCPEIKWMKDQGISTGYDDGTYRPTAVVTRMAMSAFMARLAGATLEPCTVAPFSDVPVDHPFCPEITWMKDNGISTGYDDGTYRPTADVTRMAMSAFMARLAGATLSACTSAPFSDVPIDHPFCPEISWMQDNGISTGYDDGTYQPTADITRMAMSAFMWRVSGFLP